MTEPVISVDNIEQNTPDIRKYQVPFSLGCALMAKQSSTPPPTDAKRILADIFPVKHASGIEIKTVVEF